MRPRAFALALLLLAGASLAVTLALPRNPGATAAPRAQPKAAPAPGAGGARAAASPSASPPTGEAVDLAGLRDVFRFADEREEAPAAAFERPPLAPPPEPEPPGPRLVGLMWRSGRLVAVLASEGEVVLAGPGDSVGGATVVSVGEDAVVIRLADGSDSRLALP